LFGHKCWPKPCHEEGCDDCHFDLRKTPFFCLKIATYKSYFSHMLYFLVLKISARGDSYERFGIGCQENFQNSGGRRDFFATAKITTVKIV
jgi:hypothetical protein